MRYGYGSRPGFPSVRAFGWVITLPVSLVSCLVVAVSSGSKPWGVGVGACVALFGLAIVGLGYLLAEVLGGYTPLLTLASAIPFGALFWAIGSGYAWLWAAGWTVVVVLLIGIARGIMIHADSRHTWLGTDILRGFVPRR